MECKKCRTDDDDVSTNVLEGGYITKLCEDCLNKFQYDLYTSFSFDNQVRFRYLQRLEELTEDQAEELTRLVHSFFEFSRTWVENGVMSENILGRINKLWGNDD